MLQRRFLRISIYIIFAIGLTLLLLLLQFPYRALEQRLEAALAGGGLQGLDIQGLDYGFPLALSFEGLTLRLASSADLRPIETGSGYLAPELRSLLTGSLGASFRLQAFSGKLSGRCETVSWLRTELKALQCTWSDIELRLIPLPEEQGSLRNLSGICSGRLDVHSKEGQGLASGSGRLQLRDGSFVFQGLPGRDLRISDIQAEGVWALEQGSLSLEKAHYKAKGIEGRMSGSVELRRPWLSSRSRLRGSISFSPSHPTLYSLVRDAWHKTELDFEIRGPLQRPRISRR